MTGNEELAPDFDQNARKREVDNIIARNNMSFHLDDLPKALKGDDADVMDWFAKYMGLLANRTIIQNGMWIVGRKLEEAGYETVEFDANAGHTAYGRYIIGEALKDFKAGQYPPMVSIGKALGQYYAEEGREVPVFKLTKARFGQYLDEVVNAPKTKAF